MFSPIQKPNAKMVNDRFTRFIAKRRDAVKENTISSGIIEQYGEKKQILDDVILEMDENAEMLNAEKEKTSEDEKKLDNADEAIRDLALSRRTMSSTLQKKASDVEGTNGSNESILSSIKNATKRRLFTEEVNGVEEAIVQEIKRPREHENAQVSLQRERLDFERDCAAVDQNLLMQVHENAKR